MKVNIGSIRDISGGTVDFQGLVDLGLVNEAGQLGVKTAKPLKVKGKVTNTGEGFLVEGLIALSFQANCSRCMELIESYQKIELKEEFILGFDRTEDDSAYGFQGDVIDLTECLNELVILSLPMKFLCKEDCQGFCSECGTNLNLKDCQCSVQEFDSRFEMLKSLLPTEGGGSDGKSKE